MKTDLSKFAVGSDGIELTEQKRNSLLREAMEMLHHSHLKEWQSMLMRAAALWNIKTKKLHLSASKKTFEDFCETLEYSKRQRINYENIGQRMFEYMQEAAKKKQAKVPSAEWYVFTLKDITDAFEGYFRNGHEVTMRSLAASSKNLTMFQAYLRGEEVPELQVQQSLGDGTKGVGREDSEAALNRAIESFDDDMRARAKALDIKWDAKARKFVNKDGSELTESQRAELVPPEVALQPWRDFLSNTMRIKKELWKDIEANKEKYDLFASYVPSTKFRNEVADYANLIKLQIEDLSHMRESLLARDFEELKRIALTTGDEELHLAN